MNKEDYVFTPMPDGSVAVWREWLPEPYIVWLRSTGRRQSCTCPDYFYRWRKSGTACKHIVMVKSLPPFN